MIGFLFRLLVIAAIGVFIFYAAYDKPKEKAQELIEDVQCRFLDRCFTVTFRTLPGVRVFFVDKALADREGRQVAILSYDWPYCNDFTGDIYEVPRFFETDFASIPGWAQFYVNPQDPGIIGAAIIHDWLYAYGGSPEDAAKAQADNLFRKELKNAGVNIVRRNIMYLAVANFGGEFFGDDIEMRFRNPETGAPFTKARPATLAIDQLAPGCAGFLDAYWDMSAMTSPTAYDLNPAFIDDWVDLPG